MPVITPYEIPLQPSALDLAVQLAGVSYNLHVVWNSMACYWVLDISDDNNVLIVGGIPLVTGADLLEQYQYLDIGGGLICLTDGALDPPPTYTNLGSTGHLYFFTTV